MEKFLIWYDAHILLVIKSLAGFIAFLIILFIFRLFFSKQAEVHAAAEGLSGHQFDQLEKKLAELLEKQSTLKVDQAIAEGEVPVNPVAGVSSEQLAEMGKLRLEITELKNNLKIKETEVLEAKAKAVQGASNTGAAVDNTGQLKDLNDRLTDYEKQIEQLKVRLSDYEIISEDIADLQKYRAENDDLKKQLAQASTAQAMATPSAAASSSTSPANPSPSSEPEQAPQQEKAPEPTPVAEVAKASETSTAKEDSGAAGIMSQSDIDALLSGDLSGDSEPATQIEAIAPEQTSAIDVRANSPVKVSAEDRATSDKEISAEERTALDDFEKNFTKE